MKLRVVALGQRMPAWVDAGWDEYARRMPQDLPVELVALKAEPRDRGKTAAQILAAEAARIAAACKSATLVALDERGERWTKRVLADKIARWRIEAHDVAFVIGSRRPRGIRQARRFCHVFAFRANIAARARPHHRGRAVVSSRQPPLGPSVPSRVSAGAAPIV